MRQHLRLLTPILLASLGAILAAPGAHAATITASNLLSPPSEVWRYSVAMGGEVSTLTFEADPNDAGRFVVREEGAPLVFIPPSSNQGTAPCRQAQSGWSCVVGGTSVTNSGGSSTPPVRDRVIVRGAAHGDAASSWAPEPVSVASTGGLMEFWAGTAGGSFQGSDLAVGTPAVPADVWHAGPGGACFVTPCDLRAGADRYEGGVSAAIVEGGAGADTLSGGAGDEVLRGGPGDDLVLPGAGKDTLSGDAGVDTLSFDDPGRTAGIVATFATTTAGTAGTVPYDDRRTTVGGGTGDAYDATFERYVGTQAADRLTGGSGADQIAGAGGDDVLDGGPGADVLDGGSGSDTVSYATRAAGADASLVSGTGPGGDAYLGIEHLTGGLGDDRLIGDDGANVLSGGPGADTIVGNGGVDAFAGGGGADAIFTRDGLAEQISCGDGNETIEQDVIDVVAADCPAPPATPEAPVPGPPAAPGVSPGPGSPGSGPVAPLAPTVSSRAVLTTGALRSGQTMLRRLRVDAVRPGDRITLACSGGGCRRGFGKTPTTVKAGTTVSLTKRVRGLRLAPKARLTVTIARAGAISRIVTFTMVRRKAAVRTERCQAPGLPGTRAC